MLAHNAVVPKRPQLGRNMQILTCTRGKNALPTAENQGFTLFSLVLRGNAENLRFCPMIGFKLKLACLDID